MTTSHCKIVQTLALPKLWLMTDERIGHSDMFAAIDRLPRGSGIIFRHHHTEPAARLSLFHAVRQKARKRGIILFLADCPQLARQWRADGVHTLGVVRRSGLRLTAPVHNMQELVAAQRAGAALLFISPVFSTRTHPGGRVLGTVRFGLLARKAHMPVIALGGMTAGRARITGKLGAYGWAAIDGLSQV